MINTDQSGEQFFIAAMNDISNKLQSKMKAFGILTEEEVQHEIELQRLKRYEMIADNIISWRYEYNNIILFESIWTPNSLTYKDINKDERDLTRNSI